MRSPPFLMERLTLPYKNVSDKFIMNNHTAENEPNRFRRQFTSLYNIRLEAFTKPLTAAAQAKYGDEAPFCTLSDLEVDRKCFIIGVIVKQMKLRPSVLLELAEEAGAQAQPIMGARLALDSDFLEVEDEKQIVRLGGNINVDDFVTGVVVALMGKELENETFEVEDIVYPPPMPAPSIPIQLQEDVFILFVSGFKFTGRDGEDGRVLLSLELMVRWLCGAMTALSDHTEIVSRICRIIVTGGNISRSSEDREFSEKARYLTRKEISPSVECVRNVDQFFMKLTPLIPVDLMPGVDDPTNHMLPQQPMHRLMFPKASMCGDTMFNLVSNPYQAEIGGLRLLGTSGQNLSDMVRMSSERRSAVDLLESSLTWQHFCPTAPDTTDVFPFKFSDPFMLNDSPLPDIYFAGNQSQLEHRILERADGGRTLLLAVPGFKETLTAAIVNLRTFEVIGQDFTLDEYDFEQD